MSKNNNSLGNQLKGIIEESLSQTMSIKVPISTNESDRDLLIQIAREQQLLAKEIRKLQMQMHILDTDIQTIVHHHRYNC